MIEVGAKQRALSGHQVRAVQQREALLRLKRDRGDARRSHRFATADHAATNLGLTFSHEHQRGVRQRGKVARRSDRTDGRNNRAYARVQQSGKRLNDDRPHSGQATAQTGREKQQHAAYDLPGQGVANTCGM
ncbi:MAG: hypothetical protein AMXMBFR77_10390 [Phycisphaerales bacterium]|nr:MAG: hypothetical protein BroJett004_04150 [Planctomycetota bacterium]